MKREIFIAPMTMPQLLLLPLLLLFMGCTESGESIDETRLAPSFISEITRVSGTTWETDDTVGIMMIQDGVFYTADDTPYNAEYIVDTSDSSFSPNTTGDIIYFPVDASDEVDFYAYFPFRKDLLVTDGTLALSVADQSDPESIDLLEALATGYDKYDSEVAFTFTHRLSKISFTLTAGVGMSLDNISTVDIDGLCTESTYDILTCKFGTPKEIKTITTNKESSSFCTAILIPNIYSDADGTAVYTPTTPKLTVHTEYGDFYWDFVDGNGDDVKLVAGSNHAFSVSVARTGINVSSTNIIDWSSGSGGSISVY